MLIPFATQTSTTRSREASTESLINFYAQAESPNAKNEVVLIGVPGLKTFAEVGDGPIRGGVVFQGQPYVVSGNEIFKLSSGGTPTKITGTIAGEGFVSMAASSVEIAICDQQNTGYICDGTMCDPISDLDFLGSRTVSFVDGYFVHTTPDTGQFQVSELLNGGSYIGTDVATAEAEPDNLVTTFVLQNQLYLMGEKSVEPWRNVGNVDFPFQRAGQIIIERGCKAEYGVSQEDNTMFWLGEDLIAYKLNGYTPIRVSDNQFETAVKRYAAPETAESFFYSIEGHKFWAITFDEATWVYDVATGLWHQRRSYGRSNWRARGCFDAFGKVLTGDRYSNKVYEIDPATYDEGGDPLERVAISPVIHGETQQLTIDRLEVDVEGGVGVLSGQGSDPQILMSQSFDGGRTFSAELGQSLGARGKYHRRVVWNRLGTAESRAIRLRVTDPVECILIGASADVERGEV